MQPCISALIVLFPAFTTQTYNNNLFNFPTSTADIVTTNGFLNQYQYPNGTPINPGASSSFNPFRNPLNNITLPQGYQVNLLGGTDNPLTFFVPVLWTATIFEAFYLTLFERAAAAFWRDDGPTKSLVVSIGHLQISFMAHGGSIAWNIIAAFAWNMWQAAKRGFTAGYIVDIESPNGVKMRVAMMASTQPVARDGVHQEHVEPELDPDSCDCSMTEFEDLTTDETLDENLDDYIDDFCKRHCRRRDRRRKSKRRGGKINMG